MTNLVRDGRCSATDRSEHWLCPPAKTLSHRNRNLALTGSPPGPTAEPEVAAETEAAEAEAAAETEAAAAEAAAETEAAAAEVAAAESESEPEAEPAAAPEGEPEGEPEAEAAA